MALPCQTNGMIGSLMNSFARCPGYIASCNFSLAGRHIAQADTPLRDRLVGLVVKASAWTAEDPGFDSCLRRDFSGSRHTSDIKIDTTVSTLPGAWRSRVSVGTGCPVSVDCDWTTATSHFSVAAHTVEQARPRDALVCCWDVKQPTNKRL